MKSKFNIQKTVALLLLIFGFALQIYMTVIEDELGAVPLIMILTGAAWYLINRNRVKKEELGSIT